MVVHSPDWEYGGATETNGTHFEYHWQLLEIPPTLDSVNSKSLRCTLTFFLAPLVKSGQEQFSRTSLKRRAKFSVLPVPSRAIFALTWGSQFSGSEYGRGNDQNHP